MTLDAVDADLAGLPISDGAAAFDAGWARGWTVPPILTVSEWADRYRIIPRAAGAEPGRWRTDRTPYLRRIMDDLSDHSPVREVVFKKSTQVGGTEVLNNWVGYSLHHAPCPMMVIQPTVEVAERWSKQRLQTMIEECAELRAILPPSRSRDSGNTTLMKEVPAGVLFIAGANSSSGLRSVPIKKMGADEIDEYDDNLNDQGSALELAERRTSTFRRRKLFKVSTPTVKGASAIDRAFEAGTQSHYHVPCPHCGERQRLVIDQLTADGLYACTGCGELLAEHHKTAMLAGGEWIDTYPEREIRSYHINALYSPIGLGYTWAEIAEMRAKARTNPELEVTFVNTILGEVYESESNKVDASDLRERREAWQRRTIPEGALRLTIGIDVQHNRWAVLICGWGRGESCSFVDWVEVPGDPTREEDWAELDAVVFAPIVNRFGVAMRAEVIAIDSGNWTHEVYSWVRRHQAKGVIAIKGSNQPNKPIIGKPSAQDVNWRGRTIRHGVQLWNVGVRAAKDSLFPRLMGDAGLDIADRRCHFPGDMPDDFFEQVTAERFDLTLKRWVKRSTTARNEAWDCWIYAYAAACHPRMRLHVMRDADWAALEAKLQPAVGDLFADGAPPPDEPDDEPEGGTAPPAIAAPPPKPVTPKPAALKQPTSTPANPFTKGGWNLGPKE